MAFEVVYYIIAVTLTVRGLGVLELTSWHCGKHGLILKSPKTKELGLGKKGMDDVCHMWLSEGRLDLSPRIGNPVVFHQLPTTTTCARPAFSEGNLGTPRMVMQGHTTRDSSKMCSKNTFLAEIYNSSMRKSTSSFRNA